MSPTPSGSPATPVYSTDGSVCPLADVAATAAAAGCVLVVDESHSWGTHGPRGAGLIAELGLSHLVHFITASLSKAFAGRAGFVAACEPEFARFYKMASYPAIFSSTLLPHDVAGLAATLGGSRSQIVSVEAGGEREVMQLRDELERRGVFGSVFCPPATVRRRSMVRLSLHAALTDAEAKRLVAASRAAVRSCSAGTPANSPFSCPPAATPPTRWRSGSPGPPVAKAFRS